MKRGDWPLITHVISVFSVFSRFDRLCAKLVTVRNISEESVKFAKEEFTYLQVLNRCGCCSPNSYIASIEVERLWEEGEEPTLSGHQQRNSLTQSSVALEVKNSLTEHAL